MHIPVWSLSGGTAGQSVAGLVTGLPSECAAVKIEIVVTTTDAATSPSSRTSIASTSRRWWTARLHRPVSSGRSRAHRVPAAPLFSRTIILEPYYKVDPSAPLWVRIQPEPSDPADTFTSPMGLAMVKVTPLEALAEPQVVQEARGYNSWPMIQAIGEELVCVYSRGSGHTIGEDARAVYARTSTAQWLAEHGKSLEASYILAEWLDFRGEREVVEECVLEWLRVHARKFEEGSYVLRTWLRSGAVTALCATVCRRMAHGTWQRIGCAIRSCSLVEGEEST